MVIPHTLNGGAWDTGESNACSAAGTAPAELEVKLTERDVEAIADATARKVLDAMREPTRTFGLVDARELAKSLGVSPHFVCAHATELGGMRLGPGPKARVPSISRGRIARLRLDRCSRPHLADVDAADPPQPPVCRDDRTLVRVRRTPQDGGSMSHARDVGCDDGSESGRLRSAPGESLRDWQASLARDETDTYLGPLMDRSWRGHVFERPWADGDRQLRHSGARLRAVREGHVRD
jgi:hypothetical protein